MLLDFKRWKNYEWCRIAPNGLIWSINFQNFSGGACSQTPPKRASALTTVLFNHFCSCSLIFSLFKWSVPRVRTGYGILEKLWNFEKEIPYMEKLWNLSKTAVPMEKLWNFRFGGKKCVLSLRPDFEMYSVVLMFVASVITSLGLALRTSRAIPLASAEWIPTRQFTLFVP